MCLVTCVAPLQTHKILEDTDVTTLRVHYVCNVHEEMAYAATTTQGLNQLGETLASVHRSQSVCEALEVPVGY